MNYFHSLNIEQLLAVSKDIMQILILMSFLLMNVVENQEKKIKVVVTLFNRIMCALHLHNLRLIPNLYLG